MSTTIKQGDHITAYLKTWFTQKANFNMPQRGMVMAVTAKAFLLALDGDSREQWVPFSALQDIPQAILVEALAPGEAAKTAEVPDVPRSKTNAWGHQKRAFWFAHDRPATMLAMGMGTGKSKVTVDLIVNKEYRLSLILCPKSVVKGVWPGEFTVHAGAPLVVVALHKGTVGQKVAEMKRALQLTERKGQRVVVVMNYETAWRDPMASYLLSQTWDLVALDESHRIKAPGGKASKFCADLGKRARYRLCLTGTPMPHSPLDVYAQYRFLDPRIYGTSFVRFRNRYAVMGGFGGYEVKGYQNQEELNSKFYACAFRVGPEVLDLPPVTHAIRTCTLSPAAWSKYKALEEDFYTEVEEGSVTALNALTKLLRLQQLTSGFLKLDDQNKVTPVDYAKQELLDDLLEDIPGDEPVVVFARFQHDLDIIKSVALQQGRTCGELSGRMNELAAWQQGDFNVLAVQIQAGGVGISLVRSRFQIYFSMGYSLGDYEQSLKRIDRPGQTRPVTVYHLVAEGTVDEKVYEALAKRRSVVEHLLNLHLQREAVHG